MKTLHNYLTREVAVTIGFALLVFVFALLLDQIVERLQWLLTRYGASVWTVFKLLPLLLPYVLMFALPMSVVTAMMLVFGKLSADRELMAMRASGLSVPQLVRPVFLIALGLTVVCLFLNTTLGPWCKEIFKQKLLMAVLREPHTLLASDEPTSFGNIRIYVGSRRGTQVENVRIHWLDEAGNVKQTLRAASGTLSSDTASKKIFVELHNVKVEAREASDPTNPTKVKTGLEAGSYTLELDASKLFDQNAVRLRAADLTLAELLDAMREERKAMQAAVIESRPQESVAHQKRGWALSLEAQKRFSWALACFVFALLGVPLGIQTHRRETSANAAIALLLVGLYYFLTTVSRQWENRAFGLATFWLWIPDVLFAVVGMALLWRVSRA